MSLALLLIIIIVNFSINIIADDWENISEIPIDLNDVKMDFTETPLPLRWKPLPELPNTDEDAHNYICALKDKLFVKNTIRLGSDLILFLDINGDTVPYRIENINYNNESGVSYDAAHRWRDWNVKTDGSKLADIENFISAYSFRFPEKDKNDWPRDFNHNTIIYAYLSPINGVNYLYAYQVQYSDDYSRIVWSMRYSIDPYNPDHSNDRLNMRQLYSHFPSGFESRVKPIVSLPLNDNTLPNQAIVYYEEAHPDDKTKPKQMAHIFRQTKESKWIYDPNSGCVTIADRNITAAVAISDLTAADNDKRMFFEMEFDTNGDYAVRAIEVADSDAEAYIVDMSFDSSSIRLTKSIRNLICATSFRRTTTTTDPTPDPTTEWPSTSPSTSGTTGSAKKSGIGWIWILLIVILLIILAVAVIWFLWLRYRQRKTKTKTISDDTDEAGEDVEMAERKEEAEIVADEVLEESTPRSELEIPEETENPESAAPTSAQTSSQNESTAEDVQSEKVVAKRSAETV